MTNIFYKYTLKKMPHLKELLSKAGIRKTPKQFIKESLISSVIVTTVLMGLAFSLTFRIIHIKAISLIGVTFLVLIISLWFFSRYAIYSQK